jgi:hypothetical protein
MFCRTDSIEEEVNIYQILGINVSIAVILERIICVSIKPALKQHFEADWHILKIHNLFKHVTKLFIGEMRDIISVVCYEYRLHSIYS